MALTVADLVDGRICPDIEFSSSLLYDGHINTQQYGPLNLILYLGLGSALPSYYGLPITL